MRSELSHVLSDAALLGDAARLVGSRYCPLIALVDADGRVTGVVPEEKVRLGLIRTARPEHPLASLAEPAEGFPELPLSAEQRPLPCHPPAPPAIPRALVMAGGRGTRLEHLTENLPKPLLAVRGEPLLHRILRQLAQAGIREVLLSVHYLAGKIRASVGDGGAFGLCVRYLEEVRPLGTAGALGLAEAADDPLLVMNGDILTTIHFPSFFAWHARHRNSATIAANLFQVEVPYGLAHFDEQTLEHLEEKPTLSLPVNAGIYLFEAELLGMVPANEPFDMVSWLNELAPARKLGLFPVVEEWTDIGSLARFEEADGNR